MNSKLYHAAIPMVAILLVAAVAPGLAGATGESTAELVVGVDQSGEDVTVTVARNDTAVENASVTVEAANTAYAGEGSYATDANGTVGLPAPEENVTVDVTAAKGNQSATVTVDLVGVGSDDELSVAVDQAGADVTVAVSDGGSAVENASVTVAALDNSTYAGDGEYVTDANGSVALPAPEENLSVEVTAVKGNASGSTTAELVAVEDEEQEFDSFGQRVSWFVHSLLGDEGGEGGIGDAVSEFVKNHNPSNDNRPDDAGNDESKSSGGGPPDHANNDKGDDSEDDEDEEE